MIFDRGDVVLLRFPFTDLSSTKQRRVLVLTARDRHGDFIALPVTSRPQGAPALCLAADDLARGSLPRASWVRVDRPVTLHESSGSEGLGAPSSDGGRRRCSRPLRSRWRWIVLSQGLNAAPLRLPDRPHRHPPPGRALVSRRRAAGAGRGREAVATAGGPHSARRVRLAGGGLRRRRRDEPGAAALVVPARSFHLGAERTGGIVPVSLRPAGSGGKRHLALRGGESPRSAVADPLRQHRRGQRRHVRRGVAALRAETRHRRRQNQGDEPVDRLGVFSQAL